MVKDLKKIILSDDSPPKMVFTMMTGFVLVLFVGIFVLDYFFVWNILTKEEFYLGVFVILAFLKLSLLYEEKEMKLYFSLRRETLLKEEVAMYKKWLHYKTEEAKILVEAIDAMNKNKSS